MVFEVKEVDKAFGEPCKHLGRTTFGSGGCTIYEERPLACQTYVCLWLDSQRRAEVEQMPAELRPDVCKVVMGWPWGIDRKTLFVYPYPGHDDAWYRNVAVAQHLKMIVDRGGKVVVVKGNERIVIKGDMAVVGTEDEFEELK